MQLLTGFLGPIGYIVRYPNGYPDFEPYAIKSVEVVCLPLNANLIEKVRIRKWLFLLV
jgi:hypothetical protein